MIRRLLRRRPRVCTGCGAALDRGAAWCGTCGDRVGADGVGDAAVVAAQAVQEAEETLPPVASPDVRRRGLAGVVVVALLALVTAGVVRSEPAQPLLGQVDAAGSGVSATGPPPDGLRVAWEHELVSIEGDGIFLDDVPTVVAADGRVRVGSQVVDTATGRLVRVAQGASRATGAAHAFIVGDAVVVVDTMTGAVRSRAPLIDPPDWVLDPGSGWATARIDEVSLFGGGTTSVLVADDGTTVAEVAGTMVMHLDRAVDDPAALPVRRFEPTGPGSDHMNPRGPDSDLEAPLQLIDARTGAVLLEDGGPGSRVADVVGGLALVASTESQVGAPGEGIPWTVRLVDATTGTERDQLRLVSSEAPRLLGAFDDGTAVVASRSGREVTLRAVPVAGPVRDLGTIEVTGSQPDGPYVAASPILTAVGMTAGSLIVLTDGEVHAVDVDGTSSWHRDVVGHPSLAVGDGHVVVVPDDPERALRVLDGSDGSQLATLTPATPPWAGSGARFPVGVVDGHVGLGDAYRGRLGGGGTHLGSSLWLDLSTGEATPIGQLFADAAGDEQVTGGWTFHGATLDPTTARPVPVITDDQGRAVLRILEAGEGFTTHELPLPGRDDVAGHYADPVGATDALFAVSGQSWEAEDVFVVATYVVDRRTDEILTVPGMSGLALLPDRLLGVEVSDSFDATALVSVDPVTGEQHWRAEGGTVMPWWLVAHDDELWVTAGGLRVAALDLQDGTIAWAHEPTEEVTDLAVLSGDRVLVATTDGEVVALDRSTGDELWRASVGAPIAAMSGAGDHVVVGTHDGVVVHLDQRGHEVQRVAVGTGSVESVAALGAVVVAVVDGSVVGLRADGTGITRRDEVDLP